MKMRKRTEQDSLGTVEVEYDALYGAQTQRALDNFTISKQTLPTSFIQAVILIKKCAAKANRELGLLSKDQEKGILLACDQMLKKFPHEAFKISIYQTGSGTSTNMNVNEVITGLAKLDGTTLHPNDHVNLGQSSNDVIPSAIHISSSLEANRTLLPQLEKLSQTIKDVANQNHDIIKTGRTHLMDALPMRISDEFTAWATQIDENAVRINQCLERLHELPLGGTAIGSGVNCHPDYIEKILKALTRETGLNFKKAKSLFKGISSMDTPLELSGHLKTAAMTLYKISNDLRWMNSGPLAGIAEVSLPALQPGSSIMPAKVNPVIPEAVCMASAQIAGYDTAITLAASSGNFQLNTMLPLIGTNLLNSIELLSGSCKSLRKKVFDGITFNKERCQVPLKYNPILVTALNNEIGYSRAAELGKIAIREKKTVLDVALEHTTIPESRLRELLNPEVLADGTKKSDF